MIVFTTIGKRFHSGMTAAQLYGLIMDAYHYSGYVITIDVCEFECDLMFLKIVPYLLEGRIIPSLALGVWMRGHGTFVGDLPGRGSIEKRARAFNSDVIRSRVHAGEHVIKHAFERHIVTETLGYTAPEYNIFESTDKTYIPTWLLAKRYRCAESEIEMLATQIARADISDMICNPVLSVIFEKDYGTNPLVV
jgi:hypothetical protein